MSKCVAPWFGPISDSVRRVLDYKAAYKALALIVCLRVCYSKVYSKCYSKVYSKCLSKCSSKGYSMCSSMCLIMCASTCVCRGGMQTYTYVATWRGNMPVFVEATAGMVFATCGVASQTRRTHKGANNPTGDAGITA